MLVLVAKRFWRLLLFFVILLFVLPLLHYYMRQALQPEYFPLEATPVWAEEAGARAEKKFGTRFLSYLHDFYQNGL